MSRAEPAEAMTAEPAGSVTDLDLRDYFAGAEVDPSDAEAVSEAFRRAGEELAARGGGRLYVPPGRWLLQAASDDPTAAVMLRTPGTTLHGAGILATTLKLAPGQNCHVVAIVAPGVTIERLTVAGGLDHEPAAVLAGRAVPTRRCHGISIRDCPSFTLIRDVLVEDVVGYGIGSIILRGGPKREPDPFCHVRMHNVTLRRIGDDAIDFKIDVDLDPSIETAPDPSQMGHLGPRGFLRNISVSDHSVLGPNATEDDIRGENGVDARGQLHLQNIEVIRVRPGEFGKAGGSGITFRDETGPGGGVSSASHGRGAQWSTLQNYFVACRPAIEGEPCGLGGGVLTTDVIAPVIAVGNGDVVILHDQTLGGFGNGQYRYRRTRWAIIRAHDVGDRLIPLSLRLRLHRLRKWPRRLVAALREGVGRTRSRGRA